MSNDSKLGGKIKSQIGRFAGRLTHGLNKAKCRFVGEMLYGIQAAKDVKLSNIARSLDEPIALIETEDRLSRNLRQKDLTSHINGWTCWEGAGQVDEDTVVAVDLSDVRKEYAKKMEHLAGIRDGSKGELARGYWTCDVLAAEVEEDRITPLYGELYSQEAEDFVSENDQILKAIRAVMAATRKKGIVVIDRGGDRREILIPLLDDGLRFVVRQDGDRHILMPGGKRCAIVQAARWCKGRVTREVEVESEGHREVKHLTLGSLEVRIPERPGIPLWLVVIRGFGKEPILLLTNVAPKPGRVHVVWIADVYLTRWKCEETYRFMKQSYQVEDVRVRSYISLRNTYALVRAATYFVSAVLGAKAKLNLIFKKVCEKSKRFFEVATFFHYAVADGIHRLLFASRRGPDSAAPEPATNQLVLAFLAPPPSG